MEFQNLQCEQWLPGPGASFVSRRFKQFKQCYWKKYTYPEIQESQKMHIQSLGQGGPLEEETATNSKILAWRISWTKEPGGLKSMGCQRVIHSWARMCWENTTTTTNSRKIKVFLTCCIPKIFFKKRATLQFFDEVGSMNLFIRKNIYKPFHTLLVLGIHTHNSIRLWVFFWTKKKKKGG